MNRYKSYGKGWHFESYKHSLAAKGIKTRFATDDDKVIMKTRSLDDYPPGSPERMQHVQEIIKAEQELKRKKGSRGISGPSTMRTDVIVVGGHEIKDDQGVIHIVGGKRIPKKRINDFYDDYIKKTLMKKLNKEEEDKIRAFMIERGKQMTKGAKGSDLTVEEEAEIRQNVDEKIAAAKLQFGKVMEDVKAMDGWLDSIDVTSDSFDSQLQEAQARVNTVMDQRGTIIPGQEVTRLRDKVKEIRERRNVYLRGRPEKWPPE
jgi:hypothetical protein